MKKIFNRTVACSLLAASAALAACSDAFLEEKRDFNNVSAAVYDNYEGARARLDDLYAWCQPGGSKETGRNGMNMGGDDDMAKSTEEYAGLGKWVLPTNNINTVNGVGSPDDWFYKQQNNIQQGVYGRIRNVNDVIRGIENGALAQAEKEELLGQALFWRAWCYYMLVKWYGGVPILTEVLDPVEGPGTPRSSARECFRFIFDDLDRAAAMLEAATAHGGWQNASDYGRITAGAALALKGRLMNLWASPLFNRANDPQRWTEAYEFQQQALAKIDACGHGLVDASEQTAAGWADLFVRSDRNPEAILLTIYNTNQGNSSTRKNAGWEQSIRPSNTDGGGGKQPSQLMIDLFPMSDGKLPAVYDAYDGLPTSAIAYDEACPWMNRDPRFYRTFAFPGMRWAYGGTPSKEHYPQTGADYTLWSYVWYLESNKDKIDQKRGSSSMGPNGLNGNAKGFYIRKRTCDADASSANYVFSEGFARSATPWIEIRYAEVLLNLAEVAAGAGRMDRAVELLGQIRKRAGYVEANNYGLTPAASSDQATCMAQVLYERQIELAYEGKRFDDMRRWLLFDGGVNFASIPGAPQTWILTGWGGNTCTWLGYKPLNGKRRENLEFQVKSTVNDGVGGKEWKSWDDMPDPIAKFVFEHGTFNPATGEYDAWTKGKTWNDYRSWRTGFRVQLNKLNVKNGKLDQALTKLKENFYEPYLQRKLKRGDGLTPDQTLDGMYVTFLPRYYLLGLTSNAQTKNPTLLQTIGWEDYNGGAGTFDPFASTAAAE